MITRVTETTLVLPGMSQSFPGASLHIKPHGFFLRLIGTSGRPEATRYFNRSELEALALLLTTALRDAPS